MESARSACQDDVSVMAALAEQSTAEQIGDRGGAIWAQRETRAVPAQDSLLVALEDPEQAVVVGTLDDVVVGYGVVRLETLRDGHRLGVVSDLYVEPEARQVGVGEAMVDQLLDWCRERHCRGVDALALPGNRETKNFFESFGFTARALVVHHKLSDSDASGEDRP